MIISDSLHINCWNLAKVRWPWYMLEIMKKMCPWIFENFVVQQNSPLRPFLSCWIKNFSIFDNSIFVNIWSFFFYQGFLSRALTTHKTAEEGRGDHLLFHPTTSTRSRTFKHLFATLHVRWLSHISHRNACIYQTATRWDLPPNRITIWLIDDVMLIFVCLLVELILGFVTAIYEKLVDSSSQRLSSLYYKRTD